MGAAENDYQLGHEISERHRLGLQGRVLAPATRTLLQAAGIKARMQVLDLGSRVGDAAFVAAEMVGPSGEVVGVERSAEAVDEATARTRQAGLSNVYFVQGDIYDPAPNGPFDAVICRLVLMYVADPATVLRTQSALVSPGGVVAPIEFDVLTGRSVPSTPLVQQANGWIAEAFTRGGIHPALGPKLWSVLVDAGLQPVGMLGVQPHCGPETAEGPALLAGILERTFASTNLVALSVQSFLPA